MTQNKTQFTDVTVLPMRQILSMLLRWCWLIVLSAAICGAACYHVSSNYIVPKYEATVTFYVNNKSFAHDDRLSYSDLWVAQNLVDTYMVILETRNTMEAVITQAGADLTVAELKDMLQARMVEETELFTVTVTGLEPETTTELANAIAAVLPERIATIMTGASARVADYPVLPTQPSEPAPVRMAVSGAMFGAVFCASILLLRAMLTYRIRKEEDIERATELPVLTSVPVMSKRFLRRRGARLAAADDRVCGAMAPKAAERMQRLCLKLRFCFADERTSRVIGISSAMAGEGKSTTAVNLAYSLAVLENRVLLVDCDLRRPSVDMKLSLDRAPGLSDYLVRQAAAEEIIHDCGNGFDVITSGMVPPNPIELLSAQRLAQLVQSLRESYDYIILDLPPVGEVGDAIVTARLTDGNLLVARRDHCTRPALQAAIHQFASVDARLLGVVYNCEK